MRQQRLIESNISGNYAEHEIGEELKRMSDWLDKHPEILDWATTDLQSQEVEDTGRHGMSVEAVLRCGLLKQYRQLSYKKLAFYLLDSISFKSFARLPLRWCPKKSTLQATISRIGAKTWERISRCVLGEAKEEKVEDGEMVRIDSTVTEAPIHEPSDSSLLWDSVRVMVRLLVQVMGLPGAPFTAWRNHSLVAKRRARQIMYTRGQDVCSPNRVKIKSSWNTLLDPQVFFA